MATTFLSLSPPSSTSTFLSPAQLRKPIYFHHTVNKNSTAIIRIPSSYRQGNGSNTPQLPETECPVPPEQQPINEYHSLSTSFPFSSASGDAVEFYSRLLVTGASFALFVGLPVAWFGAPGADYEPLKLILATASSGVLVVTLVVVRMYLGWAYVGNRLLSATVEYEETGWYDGQVTKSCLSPCFCVSVRFCARIPGCARTAFEIYCQIWVKTPEVLARDRLLGSFSVKPVLSRLKYTLVTLAAFLVISVLLLVNLEGGQGRLYMKREAAGDRTIPGVYNDESARSFEPDAFCGLHKICKRHGSS